MLALMGRWQGGKIKCAKHKPGEREGADKAWDTMKLLNDSVAPLVKKWKTVGAPG